MLKLVGKQKAITISSIILFAFLITVYFASPLYGKTVSDYCSWTDGCTGGCVATGSEAYCNATGCQCNCIFVDPWGNWRWHPQSCPSIF